MANKIISYEYVRGLIAGEGCFDFCTVPVIGENGKRLKVPAFILQEFCDCGCPDCLSHSQGKHL